MADGGLGGQTRTMSSAKLPSEKFLVPVDGGQLAVFRYGDGDGDGDGKGAPVLLIHGVTSSNRAFQIFADELIARGKTPYAVDLRGRADSNSLPGPFGMAQHAKDMAAVIDFFKWDRPEVIGHSMGAFVVAALIGLYPDRVGRVVFADGGIPLPLPAGMTVEQVMPFILGPALERLSMTFESKESYRDYWKEHPALKRGWGAVMEEYVDYDLRNGKPSTNPKAVDEDSRDLFGDDLVATSLRNLKEVTLLIRAPRGLQNEDGGLYPPASLEMIAKEFPMIKIVSLEDVNHYEMVLTEDGSKQLAEIIYG